MRIFKEFIWPWIASPESVLRYSLSYLLLIMPTYFRFEFRHIQPPQESNFNRLVCSRVYSLITLNLFIVYSFVQFYPIVVSTWSKITCAFFYCRISVPLGTWTRTTQIKSLVLYHWASGTYGGSPWTRTRNAEATGLQPAAIPIPLIDP